MTIGGITADSKDYAELMVGRPTGRWEEFLYGVRNALAKVVVVRAILDPNYQIVCNFDMR